MFERLTQAMTDDEKSRIAEQICTDLLAQAAAGDDVLFLAPGSCVDEARSDHVATKRDVAAILVAEILKGYPGEALFDAMVKVLAEQNEQAHFGAEDTPYGVFDELLTQPMEGAARKTRTAGASSGTSHSRTSLAVAAQTVARR